MATKAQILRRQKSKAAKARRKEIDTIYDKHIPMLLRCGNVRSIMRKVERSLTEMNRRTKKPVRGKRMPCTTITY